MGKTYIFFEPRNRIFFNTVLNTYSELINKYYTDAVKAHSMGESPNFFRNYSDALLFPACDYNSDLQCPHTICGSDKCPVLTEDQKDQITIILQALKSKLRSSININNTILERIYNDLFFLLSTKTEPFSYRDTNILALYIQFMRGISEKQDAEKLVFISSSPASSSDYPELSTVPLNKPLVECTYYQPPITIP